MNSASGERPGETWYSPATPMTDFPVQNNNAHLMPVFAALKTAGVEVVTGGLRLEPRQSTRAFSFQSELLDLWWDGHTLRGTYRPMASRLVEIVLPAAIESATASGQARTPTGTHVSFTASGETAFEVRGSQ